MLRRYLHPRLASLAALAGFALSLSGAAALGAESPGTLLVAPGSARQGDPVLVWALSTADLKDSELLLVDAGSVAVERSRAFAAPASLLAGATSTGAAAPAAGTVSAAGATSPAPKVALFGYLMAIPDELESGSYRLVLEGAGSPVSQSFVVDPRHFPLERIALDRENSDLLSKPDPRKIAESRVLDALVARVDDKAVFIDSGDFLRPVTPLRTTAGFGDRRRYLIAGGGSESSVHNGEDLAVVTGTPVLACERGKVVMCADREVTGLTVVVEHLPGLYSLYFHLSSIAVSEGQMVERGERLGLSGSTGLSTGPHLHWELIAAGRAVDPEHWVGAPLLDTKRIATTIPSLLEGR
ncbi:MAG TPA: M23 family metallopeptidase [Rectinemataceae bacterium]|nr:M23 family metallopeptidase [Rectinemataceae bacterium]